jgi:hypothetical protein
VENGAQRMPYMEYENLDACCRDNGGCGEIQSISTVWRDDKCTKDLAEELKLSSSQMSDRRCSTFFTCKECIDKLSLQLLNPDAAKDVDSTSELDLKYLFDYILYQSGMTIESKKSEAPPVMDECAPCIDHLEAKFSNSTTASTSMVYDDIQSFLKSWFENSLNEILGLKRISETDLKPLYDYLEIYSGHYLSAQNL